MSHVPVLQETCTVATYMQTKFPSVLLSTLGMEQPDLEIQHPHGWSVEFVLDVDLALDVLARAFHNQVSTNWDVRQYADHVGVKFTGITTDHEEVLQRSFKPLKKNYHLQIAPCTITDRHGRMMLWYLPNILQLECQESMFRDLNMLTGALKFDNKPLGNWRTSPEYYQPVAGSLKAGNLNISPAWFEQGHKSEEYRLKVSVDLIKDNPTCNWLRKSYWPFALMGGILSIVQPELFDIGVKGLRALQLDPQVCNNPTRLCEVLEIWQMPFSALSVISNRVTPLHCDTGGWVEWMDLMLGLGEYNNGRYEVPAFGYTFKYNPGTIVGVSSKIFRHGAICEGNRAVISFYMRDNVMN
ncbi:hypothetical protein BYT27DRAFT_7248436 [Phlegmacium glaucopus]|nr:hypothetical protein BYT27DRAFT_7248436 [Phlegmacium glaucopus]